MRTSALADLASADTERWAMARRPGMVIHAVARRRVAGCNFWLSLGQDWA